MAPSAVTSPVYSGMSNETRTWLCAPRLYTSSGSTSPTMDWSDERVVEVAVVEEEAHAALVRVAVEVVDALGVERARPPHDAVHLVPLVEEELGQVRAVLSGDAGDQRSFHA